MAIDIQKMKPSECCRTLNSTPLGTVLNDRQFYRYRTEAGVSIGDGTHVDFFEVHRLADRETSRSETAGR